MLNEKEAQFIFDQAFELWIKPEIEKRQKQGWLKKDFQFKRAQVIFTPGKKTKFKFNENIKITAECIAGRDIAKGEEISIKDLRAIKKFIVDYPKNSGHITIFRFLEKWILMFDSRYNKEKIKDYIKASEEFYESAQDNLTNNRLRPFFENCWASAELSSACHFLSLGQEYAPHDKNMEKFKNWSELGNVDTTHSEALSQLNKLRKSARYMRSEEFRKETPQDYLKIIREMITEAEKLI